MMETEYAPASYEFQQHGYTPDQMEDIGNQYFTSRGQRVRAAMFPETMDEGTEIPATQLTEEEPTAVEKLAEPSQLLKHAVSNIVNYQSDAENAVRIIPDLIKWLQDKDESVVRKTAMFIHELSKKDASRFALMRDAQIVSTLVKAIQNASQVNPADASAVNEERIQSLGAAAGTLYNLSAFPEGLSVIFKSYGIPFLIKLLGFPAEQVQKYALVTLHNLIEHQEGAKAEVFRHGGIQAMVPLLRKQSHRLVTIVCDCLKYLTLGNQEAKVIILAANGPFELLQIMKMSTYEKLLYTASSVLKAISVEPHNKKAILKFKGLDILVNCAQTRSFETSRVITNILYILRNLSDMLINDADFKDSSFDGILELIVPLLDKQEAGGRLHPQVLCAAGILSNLTCNNQPNKMKVIHLDGIPLLLRACQRYPTKEEITEPAMCTLRHITSRHPECEQARHLIHNFGGLQIIAAMLNQQSLWTLVKAIVGMIKNVAVEPTNRSPLRQLGVVNKLIELMYHAYSLIREASVSGQFNTEVSLDNVRMHDVVEACLSALYELAKDPNNRAIIRSDTRVITALVPLLAHPIENVVRSAVSVMSELSADREGCQLIELSGAVPGLTNLLHRQNAHNGGDSIGTYAVNTLYNLGEMEGKSGDYRNGLHIELMDVLAQGGNVMWGSGSEMPADYDFLLSSNDYPHQYHSSGPPSVHGSVYGTNLSVYDPDAMDISNTPNQQVWEQYASATPINSYDISHSYHGAMPLPDSGSWKDSDV